jgi:hypothetical protein
MTGIVGLFTGFEQLQITSIYDTQDGIYVTVQNTGTSTATITDIYVNGFPSAQISLKVNDSDISSSTITLTPGNSTTLKITLPPNGNGHFIVSPGVSLEIKLHTASGKDYPKLIVLQAYKGSQSGQ